MKEVKYAAIKTQQVKIYPNRTMTKEINRLFDYRRYGGITISGSTNTRLETTKVIRLLDANSNHLHSGCVKEGKQIGKERIE